MAARKVVCQNEEGSVRMVFEVDPCRDCPKFAQSLLDEQAKHATTKTCLQCSRDTCKAGEEAIVFMDGTINHLYGEVAVLEKKIKTEAEFREMQSDRIGRLRFCARVQRKKREGLKVELKATKSTLHTSRECHGATMAANTRLKTTITTLEGIVKQKTGENDKLATEFQINVGNFKQMEIWYKQSQYKHNQVECSFQQLKVIAARKDGAITKMQKEAACKDLEIEKLQAKLNKIMRVFEPEPGAE